MSAAKSDPFAEASSLHAAGKLVEAELVLEKFLAAEPRHAAALNLLGIVAGQQGRLDQARDLVGRAIASGGDNAVFLRNLCELHRLAGAFDAAVAAGQRAVAVSANDPVARMNLAMAQYDAFDYDAALADAEQVLTMSAKNASAHFLRAQILLARGEFAEGFSEYEWRWGIAGAERPRPAQEAPIWDGGMLDGVLMLLADQGFGDMIQFSRYLPWAADRCAELVVSCPPELRALLARSFPQARFLGAGEEAPIVAAHNVFSSLPFLAGTLLDTVPASVPYLRVDPARVARWSARLAALTPPGLRRIGIAWAGRPEHRGDRQRSLKLADLAPLASLPGIVFVSLQKGAAVQQAGDYFGQAPLVNLGVELENFDDTASVVTALDAVVTVDTSVAHLAGALGENVHVLLPHRPDWRWLLGRTDSPWYPSVLLTRDLAGGHGSVSIINLAARLNTVNHRPPMRITVSS